MALLKIKSGTSRLALALAMSAVAMPAWAQAPETQSQANPAPAEQAAGEAAGQANTPGVGNAPTTQAATDTSVAEEIVVTAQFREENLQDTPLAITAMSASMLEARSQTDISQVAAQAPNVTLKPQGAAFGPSLAASIRGIGQYDFNPALEPGVGVYVDDVYYATLTGSVFDLLDLERVEILRGPQGTLAGRNSIGGAVKLYSKRPTGDGSGYVSAAYGSRDRLDLRGSIDFPLTETVAARLSGVAKKQDGYVKRLDFGCVNPPGSALNPAVGGVQPLESARSGCLVAREGEVDYNALRGQLRFTPTDNFEINLIGDYTHEDRTNAGQVLIFANNPSPWIRGNAVNVPYDSRFICGKYCNYASYYSPGGTWSGPVAPGYPLVETRTNGRAKFKGWGVSGQIEWDATDNLQLVSITAYRDYRTKFSNDDDLSPLAHSNGEGDLSFWSFSQELRLNGAFGADDMVEYTLGGYYSDQKSVYGTFQDLRYPVIPLQFVGDDPVKADSKAVFAHVAFHPTDQLTLTGGLRYTKESKDYSYVRLNRDGTPNPFLGTLNGQVGKYRGDRVDWRANVQYEFTPDITAYAQASTGFKGGGVNPRPFNPAQVQPFGPEKLTAYEVGFKSDLFDRLVRVNIAGFYNKYKDIQLTLLSCPQFGGPGPCALPANAGDATIKGVELETSLRPAEGFLIDGAVSYLDFEYDSINPQAGGPTSPAGVQLSYITPYTSKWKWSVGAQYEVQLPGNAGSLTPRIDASYQSSIFSNAVNGPLNRIGGYTVANARLTWRNADEDLEISGEVTNLFDKYYFLTSFDLTGAGAGFAEAQPGRPREWALTVKKKF